MCGPLGSSARRHAALSEFGVVQELAREGIPLTREVLCQRFAEGLATARGGEREQRHTGAKLQVIRVAEDCLHAAALDAVHQLRAPAQPLTEERMVEVRAPLGE
jgi:hypothetical protein